MPTNRLALRLPQAIAASGATLRHVRARRFRLRDGRASQGVSLSAAVQTRLCRACAREKAVVPNLLRIAGGCLIRWQFRGRARPGVAHEVAVSQLRFRSCAFAVALWQLLFGSCSLAVALWQLLFGSCSLAVALWQLLLGPA
jgi:hypothetical protein